MNYRIEKDLLGEVSIPEESYWGVHTSRAIQNFAVSEYLIHPEFIKGYGQVKLACALTIDKLGKWEHGKAQAIIGACREMAEGKLNEHIVVDPLQGGAGTSLNMNVNEVIANRALELYGKNKGEYGYIDPLDDINLYQSTNDTFPTALKIACISLLRELEVHVTALQDCLQDKEREFADIVKVGRTQLMDAVLITLGKEFSAYAEAVSRDRWRIYKCEERLRTVNLGGTAVGTGLGAPRKYIFGVVEELRALTGIGLARAENLLDNTQNADVFAEVSGILKAHGANLIKISNDLRLMNSGPYCGLAEITLPAVQAGSSIMAGKVNPVIPEMAAQAGIKVFGNDVIINQCASMGQLELNQFMPLIGFSILESLSILINANKLLGDKCIDGIVANTDNLKKSVDKSHAVLFALLPKLGYSGIADVAEQIKGTEITPREYVLEKGLVTQQEYDFLTSPDAVLALGFS